MLVAIYEDGEAEGYVKFDGLNPAEDPGDDTIVLPVPGPDEGRKMGEDNVSNASPCSSFLFLLLFYFVLVLNLLSVFFSLLGLGFRRIFWRSSPYVVADKTSPLCRSRSPFWFAGEVCCPACSSPFIIILFISLRSSIYCPPSSPSRCKFSVDCSSTLLQWVGAQTPQINRDPAGRDALIAWVRTLLPQIDR